MANSEFYKGETVVCSVEIRRTAGNALVDPSSVKITITKTKTKVTDVEVVKVDNVDMEKASTGIYAYNYDSDTVGRFSVLYTMMDASKQTMARDSFTVIN